MNVTKRISMVVASLLLLFALFVPSLALAADDSTTAACEGLKITGGGSCDAPAPGSTSVESVIKTVINLMSIVVGVVAVVMIIIGGLKYVISSGDSNNINSAKNTILYAIIGLVIVSLAQVIVRYVLKNVK